MKSFLPAYNLLGFDPWAWSPGFGRNARSGKGVFFCFSFLFFCFGFWFEHEGIVGPFCRVTSHHIIVQFPDKTW